MCVLCVVLVVRGVFPVQFKVSPSSISTPGIGKGWKHNAYSFDFDLCFDYSIVPMSQWMSQWMSSCPDVPMFQCAKQLAANQRSETRMKRKKRNATNEQTKIRPDQTINCQLSALDYIFPPTIHIHITKVNLDILI